MGRRTKTAYVKFYESLFSSRCIKKRYRKIDVAKPKGAF